jgi:hypothetical protein
VIGLTAEGLAMVAAALGVIALLVAGKELARARAAQRELARRARRAA